MSLEIWAQSEENVHMHWMMKGGSMRVSTGIGSLWDFANTKMNLPIPSNKGEITDRMGA